MSASVLCAAYHHTPRDAFTALNPFFAVRSTHQRNTFRSDSSRPTPLPPLPSPRCYWLQSSYFDGASVVCDVIYELTHDAGRGPSKRALYNMLYAFVKVVGRLAVPPRSRTGAGAGAGAGVRADAGMQTPDHTPAEGAGVGAGVGEGLGQGVTVAAHAPAHAAESTPIAAARAVGGGDTAPMCTSSSSSAPSAPPPSPLSSSGSLSLSSLSTPSSSTHPHSASDGADGDDNDELVTASLVSSAVPLAAVHVQ